MFSGMPRSTVCVPGLVPGLVHRPMPTETQAKKKRAGNAYSAFVKMHFQDPEFKDLASKDRFREIGKLWQAHKASICKKE